MKVKFKEYIDKLISLVDSYNEWDHIHGMIMFEFYPNKIAAPLIYLENKNMFENLTTSKTGLAHDILTIAGDIHECIEEDTTLVEKPDLLLFNIDHDTRSFNYKFNYGVFATPGYSSFDEMLYFEYHLMGQIPKDDFNKSLLNNALRYHGETPVD